MWWALLLLLAVLLFGFVLIFGPPFVPTLRSQIVTALDVLDLQPGQKLLELGSGDGRVAKAAAQRGLWVVGIELNPLLVLISRLRTWRYRHQVRIIWGDYFRVRWPEADAIFTFMIPRQMATLDRKIKNWHQKKVYLASYAFHIPGKEPVRKKNGILLYEYKK